MRLRPFSAGIALLALALAVVLVSCGGAKRDISTPETALLGHWVTTQRGAKANYYFGDHTLVVGGPGRYVELTYDVVYSDDGANKIVIEISMDLAPDSPLPFSVGMEKELTFSKNRKSLTEVTEMNGIKITNKWKYVDAKTRP